MPLLCTVQGSEGKNSQYRATQSSRSNSGHALQCSARQSSGLTCQGTAYLQFAGCTLDYTINHAPQRICDKADDGSSNDVKDAVERSQARQVQADSTNVQVFELDSNLQGKPS